MARKQQSQHIPANFWNELRRVLAVNCPSYLFACEKMKVKKDQQHLVEECYHGEESKRVTLHKDLPCKGQAVYAYLYKEREDQVTGSPSSSSWDEGKLQLKAIFTCSHVPYLTGEHIMCEVIECVSFTGEQIMEGRALSTISHASHYRISVKQTHMFKNTSK
jgi:RNase P subunit RPR2